MPFELPFTKMHGLGNDYVYVNCFDLDDQLVNKADWPEIARRVSNRNFGIGSDGLILLMKTGADGADVQMRMFNADGSESEMCGNGIRCVCKLAFDRDVTTKQPMQIETGRGVLSLAYETGDEAGQKVITQVAVEMGTPILALSEIPIDPSASFNPQSFSLSKDLGVTDAWVKACGAEDTVGAVSMGNPHLVIYVDDLEAVPLASAGSQLENHRLFPNRMNVHFVKIESNDHVRVLHWERGSGPTLACGTGACGVCVAGVLLNKTAREITADLPGGPLKLNYRESDSEVIMTGPATEVFTGTIKLDMDI